MREICVDMGIGCELRTDGEHLVCYVAKCTYLAWISPSCGMMSDSVNILNSAQFLGESVLTS